MTPGEVHWGELLVGFPGLAGKAFTVNAVPKVVVPPGVVTLTFPVVPVPIVTVIEVAVLFVIAAAVPPIVTLEVPDKLVPVIVNEVPTQPLVALSPEITGAAGKLNNVTTIFPPFLFPDALQSNSLS
ncbi:hypothetical protein D3C86_1243810 [compost metagenome]